MRSAKRVYLVLAAAVAGLPLLAALPAFGQSRVNTDGRALDANTQVGSGGYNNSGGGPAYQQQVYQPNIATGNVTGGFGFSGRTVHDVNLGVGFTDPFAFRGLLAGEGVDQFISVSTGVPTMSNPFAASSSVAQPPQPFYGTSNTVSRPPGTALSETAPAYVPAQPQYQTSNDTRVGTIDFSAQPVMPKPDEMMLPGQVDTTAQVNPPNAAALFAASPLYGVRTWQFNNNQSQLNSQQPLGTQQSSIFGGPSPLQQGAGLAPTPASTPDQTQIRQLRQQLMNQSTNNGQATGASQNLSGHPVPAMRPGMDTGSNPNQPMQPLAPGNSQITPTNMSPQADVVSTLPPSRQYLTDVALPTPAQQSTQYAQLEQMMKQYNASHPKSDEEANRDFQQILKLRAQIAANAETGADVLGGPLINRPGNAAANGVNPGGANPSQPNGVSPLFPPAPHAGANLNGMGVNGIPTAPGIAPSAAVPPPTPQPLQIKSFATGVKVEGLADLIADGETLVLQQKYDRAIAKYDDAIQVAPNNPLILMARANAEIGGGYYAQAYSDLHDAIAQDPAVLIGQYDLSKHFGADRLTAVLDDLKEIVKDSPNDQVHAFLYTYVLYNSQHLGLAATWLDNTAKRAGGKDPAVVQMEKYWNFSEPAPVTSPPKPAAMPTPAVKPSAVVPPHKSVAQPSTKPSR